MPWMKYPYQPGFEDNEPMTWVMPTTRDVFVVQFCGRGRYAVIQEELAGGVPVANVVDVRAGTARVLDGYRVLFVEPDAPVAWVEPVDEGVFVDDGLADVFDHVPSKLLRVRLDNGSAPRASDGRWEPIKSSSGLSAYLIADGSVGGGPSSLAFGREGESEVVTATLENLGFTTFVPVGWSPSGRYFAIEGLVGPAGENGTGSAPVQSDGLATEHRLVVLDGRSGKVIAYPWLPAYGAAPAAVWAQDADELVWLQVANVEPAADKPNASKLTIGCYSLRITPDGRWQGPRLASGDPIVVDAGADSLRRIVVTGLGTSSEGPLLYADRAVYRLEGGRLRKLRTVDADNAVPAWHRDYGLVWAEIAVRGEAGGPVLKAADLSGSGEHIIWSGLK
ncbi:MAG: hypothetical protein H5T75_04595 [Coriobacteriia bacterium]|nr:hypothetical protein [Coriobacteriia bacterium]MDI6844264.1 hypothetical protein [Anaerosomatales bacterium]